MQPISFTYPRQHWKPWRRHFICLKVTPPRHTCRRPTTKFHIAMFLEVFCSRSRRFSRHPRRSLSPRVSAARAICTNKITTTCAIRAIHSTHRLGIVQPNLASHLLRSKIAVCVDLVNCAIKNRLSISAAGAVPQIWKSAQEKWILLFVQSAQSWRNRLYRPHHSGSWVVLDVRGFGAKLTHWNIIIFIHYLGHHFNLESTCHAFDVFYIFCTVSSSAPRFRIA